MMSDNIRTDKIELLCTKDDFVEIMNDLDVALARIKVLENAISLHIAQFPPYALHTLDLRNAMAAADKEVSDE